MLAQLLETYPDDVRIVYRHFPLMSIHNKAALATQAAEAAGIQGKFWEMHDLLFERQSEWASSNLTIEQFEQWLIDQASQLGVDGKQFQTDLTSPELVAFAQEAWERGQQIGLPGTPFLLINGQPYQGSIDLGSLSAITKVSMMSDQQFTECPSMVIDPTKKYTATLQTEKGDIVIELFANKTPITVNNFIFLAQQGWFDGVSFHRVLPGFVAQSGDPSGTGFGTPGYKFNNEIVEELKFDRPGVVGMANSGANNNGSQFFIALDALENLNGNYTIFGQVVEGLDVVKNLTPRDPSQSFGLPPGDLILKVNVSEQ